MKLTELRVNHLHAPMGYQTAPLSFSWKVTEAAAKQAWARVCVYQGEKALYDSGEDACADSMDYALTLALQPRTAYRWTVEVMADNGESARAESTFETGKLEELWQGRWITAEMDADTPAILMQRFEAPKAENARLYITGLGVYEAYLNGKKVGEEFLAPGYHSYDFHVQVSTYDVTDYLQEGSNELQVWLGDGWYRGRLGFDGGYTNLYGDRCYCIAELYAGDALVLRTDSSWKSKPSPVTFSNIYDGEFFDANLLDTEECYGVREEAPAKIGSLNEALSEENRAMQALCDRMNLPIVKKEHFTVQETILTPRGERVWDFGQELTGWVEFDASLPAGTRVRLVGSEIMQDGCFYHENYRTAKTEFIYISDGKERHVRPHFTFYGFRYMLVEYLAADGTLLDGDAPISNVTAWHLRSDFDEIGSIETALPKVNKLFSNAMWGQKGNFLDVPTDCPQRDERLGWTGDAQVFSETACYNMFMPAFYRKYLWDMRSEQSILGGSVPNVVPRLKEGMVKEHGSCPWADAGVVIPWNVWQHYGSKTLLAECYPGMKAWVDCQKEKDEQEGGPHLVKGGFHFADWLALDNPMPGPFGATDPLYIASAYYYRCTKSVAEAAGILGYAEDAAQYTALADQIKKAIQDKYFDENGECVCKTQTGSAMAITYGLIPDNAQPGKEGEALENRVKENNNHLNTGFVGTTILCPALTESGYNTTAVDLLLNEDFPSWLYSVNLGATTIWERWNSVEADGSMNPEGMNSLNHYSYGSIEAWMYKYTCGISPLEAGFRRARIAPHADARLGYVNGSLNTSAGLYRSSWRYENGKCVYEVEVPFNAEAEFVLNGKTTILAPGKYIMEE